MIEIYTQPNCAPCVQAKRWLTKNNVEFVDYDVTQDNEALNRMLGLRDENGNPYMGTPVFQKEDKHFAGFNIKQLSELV